MGTEISCCERCFSNSHLYPQPGPAMISTPHSCGVLHAQQVEGLEGVKVTAVAAGREHALAVTSAGHVYSWGGRNLLAGRLGDTTVGGCSCAYTAQEV